MSSKAMHNATKLARPAQSDAVIPNLVALHNTSLQFCRFTYRVLPSFIEFYRVLSSFIELY